MSTISSGACPQRSARSAAAVRSLCEKGTNVVLLVLLRTDLQGPMLGHRRMVRIWAGRGHIRVADITSRGN